MEEGLPASAPLSVTESGRTSGRSHQKIADGCGKLDSTGGVQKQISSGRQSSTTATITIPSPSYAAPSTTIADSNVPSLSQHPSCHPSATPLQPSASTLHARQIQALNGLLQFQQQVTAAGAARNVSSQAPGQQASKVSCIRRLTSSPGLPRPGFTSQLWRRRPGFEVVRRHPSFSLFP